MILIYTLVKFLINTIDFYLSFKKKIFIMFGYFTLEFSLLKIY